ncbi:hypothetical protein DYB32_009337 [Aphanomyces invadans]|uniref:Mediator complex subunit 15 KIX domain-containing protein n=1 Tax=Aphanomyces invadans TaxID=157072 RepID=A0A418AIH9_9STRA|nr:hypothetical protein DYB32_009337 [Aphanomyces invadans]
MVVEAAATLPSTQHHRHLIMRKTHAMGNHDVTHDERAHYVRRLVQEVVKVYTLLHSPFDRVAVHETCKALEHEVWETAPNADDYVRQIRAQVQSISKRGRCLLQQRDFEDASRIDSRPPTTAQRLSLYDPHTLSATPEESKRHLQQAHLRQALSTSWLKSQRKATRFRWEGPADVQEEAYVQSVQKAARSDIYEAVRNLYYNQLVTYEEQLRQSLDVEHRDWVAYDLSVVQGFLATLNSAAPTSASHHHHHHNTHTLHCQIEKVLKEKALFDYMWEMERCKVFNMPISPDSNYLHP